MNASPGVYMADFETQCAQLQTDMIRQFYRYAKAQARGIYLLCTYEENMGLMNLDGFFLVGNELVKMRHLDRHLPPQCGMDASHSARAAVIQDCYEKWEQMRRLYDQFGRQCPAVIWLQVVDHQVSIRLSYDQAEAANPLLLIEWMEAEGRELDIQRMDPHTLAQRLQELVAEDLLFELVERNPNPEYGMVAEEFYNDLTWLTDEDLARCDFSRDEIEEGRWEIRHTIAKAQTQSG